MALKGDLASVDLAQVFQMLVLNQKEGILSIISDDSWKALYFCNRGVTLHYNPYTFPDRVLEFLVRTDRLTAENVDQVREYLKRRGGEMGEAVEMTGGMDREDFERVFSSLMEEEIYDLFFWKNARFEFFENRKELPGKEGVIDDRYFFNPDSMIMEAARRMDEWSVIVEKIPTAGEILAPAVDIGQVNVMELDDNALSVFDLVDGKRNVERIAEIAGVTSFNVFKALMTLLDQGYVKVLTPQELAEHARECLAEGRTSDGINLLERAAAGGVGGFEVHLTVAQAYESIEELEKAAKHYKQYAEGLAENERFEDAIQVLGDVIALVPTDLRARERMISLIVAAGGASAKGETDPVAEGRNLIDIYVTMNELERARSVVEGLLEIKPGDLDLIKSLVNIHSKAGDSKRVVELYEVIADQLIESKDLMGAINFLQKILKIDKARKDISDRIRHLYQQEERTRSRRRGLATLVAGGLFLLALGMLYSWYEINARNAFARIEPGPYLHKQDFAGAINLYQVFIDKHPLSLTRGKAQEKIEEIQARELRHRQKEEASRRKAEQELAAGVRRYEEYYRKYREQGKKQEGVSRACAFLAKALEAVDNCGEQDSLEWVESGELRQAARRMWLKAPQLRKDLEELRGYLDQADQMAARMREFLGRGRYRQAFHQAKQILARYPLSPTARNLRIPLRLVTDPPGAEIRVGGKALRDVHGKLILTPYTFMLGREEELPVVFHRQGYKPVDRVLSISGTSPLKILLPLEPRQIYDAGFLPAYGAVAGGGRLAVGLSGGRMVGLDPAGGKRIWLTRLPGLSEMSAGPALGGGRIFVSTSGSSFIALDAAEGSLLWQARTAAPCQVRPLCAPGGDVFAAGGNDIHRFAAADGRLLWRTRLGGELEGGMVAFKGALCLPLSTGRIAVVDQDSGSRIQEFDCGGVPASDLVLAGSLLLVATDNGKVSCFDLASGEAPWVFDHQGVGARTSLAPAGGKTLVVAREDGTVFKLDLATGENQQVINLDRRIVGGPFWTGRNLYLGVLDKEKKGLLICLDPDTLVPRWKYRFRSRLMASMRVEGGLLYVPCSDHRVYTFP